MKKILVLAFVFVSVVAGKAKAQSNIGSSDYKTALGVLFYPGGITIKHFLNEKHALEGIVYFWNNGTRITGLYEIHGDINGAEGLKWFIGPGAHIGFYNDKYNNGRTIVGIDGILGLDYKIKNAPINLSVQWQPSFDFVDGGDFYSWGGLAVRYVF